MYVPNTPLNEVFLSCKRHFMLSVGTKTKHDNTPPKQPAKKALLVVGTSWGFSEGCKDFNAIASPVNTSAYLLKIQKCMNRIVS